MSCSIAAMNASSPGSCHNSLLSSRAATARVSVVVQYHLSWSPAISANISSGKLKPSTSSFSGLIPSRLERLIQIGDFAPQPEEGAVDDAQNLARQRRILFQALFDRADRPADRWPDERFRALPSDGYTAPTRGRPFARAVK